jgi:phosphohistidine phosphatase SixA
MKFVLFRHAHKGFTPFEDPELSPRGFQQATKILALVRTNLLPKPTELFVSPRRRTSQTFYPLSRELQISFSVSDLLDQRKENENLQQFRLRIAQFIEGFSDRTTLANKTVFVCTHYDWIEEAMSLINCDRNLDSFEFSHWAPAQYLVLELVAAETQLWSYKINGQVES